MTAQEAAREYALEGLRREMAFLSEKPPAIQERLRAQLTPQREADYLAKQEAEALAKVARWSSAETLYADWRKGAFHPSNKRNRHLFSDVTGRELPVTVSGTDAIILVMIGRDVVEAHEKQEAADFMAKEADKQAKARAEAEAESARFNGFGDDMKPLGRGKARKALEKSVSADGVIITIRELVRAKIATGYTVNPGQDGVDRLENADGVYLDEKQLGKTAFAYAAHLIALQTATP